MKQLVCTFSIMRALSVRLIVVEKIQNYEKIVFMKNVFENGWWGCIPHIPPGSAPARTDNNVCYHYTNQPIWFQNDVGQILSKLFWNNITYCTCKVWTLHFKIKGLVSKGGVRPLNPPHGAPLRIRSRKQREQWVFWSKQKRVSWDDQ